METTTLVDCLHIGVGPFDEIMLDLNVIVTSLVLIYGNYIFIKITFLILEKGERE